MKLLVAFLAIFTCFSVEILSQDIDPNSFDFDFDFDLDETTPEFEYTTLNPELLFPGNDEEPGNTERSVEVFSEWPISGPNNTGDAIADSEESSKESTTVRPMKDRPTVNSTTPKSTTPKSTTQKTTTSKSTTPKTTIPKSTTPISITPTSTTPKIITPKPTTAKTTTSKPTTPKTTTNKPTTPKTTTPKPTTPKNTTAKTTTPRSITIKPTTPKTTTPKITTPRSTTIKPTTPKTTTTTTEFVPEVLKNCEPDNKDEESEVPTDETDGQAENDDDTELQFVGEKIPIPDEIETPVKPVLRIPNDIMDILKGISDCCTDESSEESSWTPEQPIEPQIIHVKSIPIVPVAKRCYYEMKAGPNVMNGDSIYGRILNGISVQRCFHCCETSTYRQCSFTYARDCLPSVVNIQEQTPYYQRGRGIIRISNWG